MGLRHSDAHQQLLCNLRKYLFYYFLNTTVKSYAQKLRDIQVSGFEAYQTRDADTACRGFRPEHIPGCAIWGDLGDRADRDVKSGACPTARAVVLLR